MAMRTSTSNLVSEIIDQMTTEFIRLVLTAYSKRKWDNRKNGKCKIDG